jgi:uncharacterized protein YjiK
MLRAIYLSLFVVALVVSFTKSVSYFEDGGLSLVYVDRFEIANQPMGLNEPSGLTLSHDRNALWTISDDTKKVFQLSLDGKLQRDRSFEIPGKGMEGIALEPSGEFLFMVNENENEVIKLNLNSQEIVDRKCLSQMAGYEALNQYFVSSPPNKGLEGITWNTDTGTILVVKEGMPGMLIEISADLTMIQNHTLLADENGFVDDDVFGDDLDFSGICYDLNRKQLWIVSDKGQRLFLYDKERNVVTRCFALGYGTLWPREIEKAEGVAIDPGADRLYVVSDKEARLYVFDIRE